MSFWLRLYWKAIREFLFGNHMIAAASISFYALFSLFPLLIFLCSIAGMFLQNNAVQEKIIEGVVAMIPSSGAKENLVVNAVRGIGAATGVSGSIGLALLAWSGTGMFRAIRHAIEEAYDVKIRRAFILRLLTDLLLLFSVGIFLLLSFAITAFLEAVGHLTNMFSSFHQYPVIAYVVRDANLVWRWAYHLIPIALSSLAFFVIFWIVPSASKPANQLWTGAITAAVLLELTKMGFVYYITHFTRYDVVFGSLGAVVVFLFGVYLSALTLLFGAEVIAAFGKGSKKEKPQKR